MQARQYFGTDGIRGPVGEGPISPDFCLKLGWAAGKALGTDGSKLVVIGKDTRISGYMIESVLEAGLAAAGVDVGLLSPIPTPAVAYLTRTLGADAGIVISASHNPYDDNGIKFFDSRGNKLGDETELAIEAMMEKPITSVRSADLGKAFRVEDARGRYIEFCKSTLDRGFRLQGLKVVLDCANGATYAVAPGVFTELGADVTVISADPNGMNINDACGSTYPQALQAKVRELEADVGIAFDGDGDRVVMVDHMGELVDGDELLFVIASAAFKSKRLNGGVVGTVMTNLGFETALKQLEIPFERAPVGDRYVLERMRQRGWVLGGESSGHIICLDLTTTGDGIVSALQVLATMLDQGRPLAELKAGMSKFPQRMVNVEIDDPKGAAVCPQVTEAVGDVERSLGATGRVLIRPSGTEPVVRVMVEGEDEQLVVGHAESLADVVRQVAAH